MDQLMGHYFFVATGGDQMLGKFSRMSITSLEQVLQTLKASGLDDNHPAVQVMWA